MLQVFESLSKTYYMVPQRDVALKVALCAMLYDVDFKRNIVTLLHCCVKNHLHGRFKKLLQKMIPFKLLLIQNNQFLPKVSEMP